MMSAVQVKLRFNECTPFQVASRWRPPQVTDPSWPPPSQYLVFLACVKIGDIQLLHTTCPIKTDALEGLV